MRAATQSVTAAVLLLAAATGQARAAEMLPLLASLQVEQLEYRLGGGGAVAWEGFGWIGRDFNKLYLKTEGEHGTDGSFDEAEAQLLYSRLITPFLDLQAGLRQDLRPEPGRSYGVVGLMGELPYGVEIDAAAFLSDRGDLSARLELEYDLPITQDLILQPKLEIDAALQEVPALHAGSGITDLKTGLRLRYHLRPELAPYIGLGWERQLGRTATYSEAEGEDPGAVFALIGLRFWF